MATEDDVRDGVKLPSEKNGFPAAIDDSEVLQREAAMDSGEEQTLSKQEFLAQVGRGLP